MILNQKTATNLKKYLRNPSQVLLLSGSDEASLEEAQNFITYHLLGENLNKLTTDQYVKKIKPESSVISIESIRELSRFLALKATSERKINKVVLIQKAHRMTVQAQNAILKMLEDTPDDTVFILSPTKPELMLTTVVSRSQRIDVLPVSLDQALKHFDAQFDENEIKKVYGISEGRIGLMNALLTDPEHALKNEIKNVKKFLLTSKYDRIQFFSQNFKEKDDFVNFVETLLLVSMAAQKSSGEANDKHSMRKWIKTSITAVNAAKQLQDNVQPRLVALSLALNT